MPESAYASASTPESESAFRSAPTPPAPGVLRDVSELFDFSLFMGDLNYRLGNRKEGRERFSFFFKKKRMRLTIITVPPPLFLLLHDNANLRSQSGLQPPMCGRHPRLSNDGSPASE